MNLPAFLAECVLPAARRTIEASVTLATARGCLSLRRLPVLLTGLQVIVPPLDALSIVASMTTHPAPRGSCHHDGQASTRIG